MNQNTIDKRSAATAALVFLLAFLSGVAWNKHRYEYHRDEPSKVNQIMSGERNLLHPTLMLEVVNATAGMVNTDRTKPQDIAVLGRTLSAVWMALAAAVLFLAGVLRGGWRIGVPIAVICILHPIFIDVAHRFKEDAPQQLGMALCLLAASIAVSGGGSRAVAIVAGIGCGIAGASKYAGFVWLLPMLALVLALPDGGWRKRTQLVAILLTAVALPFLLLHARYLIGEEAPSFGKALDQELHHLRHGHGGLGASVPNWAYFFHLLQHTWLVFLLLPLLTWKRWRCKFDWPLALFAIGWFVLLVCLPKTGTRYLLPCTVILVYFSGLALGSLKGQSQMLAAGAAVVVLLFGGTLVLHGYATDSRKELARRISELSPQPTAVAAAEYVQLEQALHDHAGTVPTPEVYAPVYLPELGSPAEMNRRGISHVVVCNDTSFRFTGFGQRPSIDRSDEWNRNREVYLAIRDRGKLLWSSPARTPLLLHPGLKLYELPEGWDD